MKKAFLSHSSAQKDFVCKVADLIGHDHLRFDMQCFEPGMELNKAIKENIDNADLFVIFFSKHIRDVFAYKYPQRDLIYPIKVLHEICKKQDCIPMKVSILKEYGYHDER